MKKVFSAIWNFLKKDWLTKILAVVFAFVIWSYVIADQNPVREIIVNDIPVSYQGAEELSSRQLIVNTLESDAPAGAKVSMSAQQSLRKSLTQNNISVYADLSTITVPGTHEVELRTSTPYTVQKINSISPATVTVVVEQAASKAIPVTCELTGDVQSGMMLGSPEITAKSVMISGPRSFVDQVARGVCIIDASVITEDVMASYPVNLLGYDSEPIDSASMSGSVPYANVKLTVLPTKNLIIDTNSISITNVAEGYEVTDIAIEPTVIEVAGPEDDLAPITSIHIPYINVGGADTTVTVDVSLPDLGDGMVYTNTDSVNATVTITEKRTTDTFSSIPIEIRGADENLRYSLSKSSTDVNITGGLTAMQQITSKSIVLYADVAGLSAGTHKIKIKHDPIFGIYQSDVMLKDQEIEVTVRK